MKIQQHIVTWSGAFLIFVGVGLVIAQMLIQLYKPETSFPPRSFGVGALGATASVQTTYVGLVMIVAGAALEVVGFIGAKPWRHKTDADDTA